MGPHPAVAAVRTAVRTALADLDARRSGADAADPGSGEGSGPASVLVALSGGADSTALAAAVAFLAARDGRSAGAVVVDHGLQPGSASAARRAGNLAFELGLDPVHVVAVDVGSRGGPEGAARTARYRALDALADAASAAVLLGHTRDDQAETVLLGLARGSGPRSVAGMAPWDGRHVRPLLDIDRSTTRAACAALGLSVWDDPHNVDPRYTRVRLRQNVLPRLDEAVGGGVAAALARTGRLLREDLEALDELAATVSGAVTLPNGSADGRAGPATLDAVALAMHPRAIRTRVLRTWCAEGGVAALGAVHLDALDRLVTAWHGQSAVDLPGGYAALRRSGRLALDRPVT
ncbi:MAG: tRNA lysidine(34) synthetase TilS [bacterium]